MAKTIDVFANPYCAVDADGVPQGVVQKVGSRTAYVGAHRDVVASERTGKTRFYFTGKKVTLPFSGEVARAVLSGALIAATVEGARLCGIPEAEFEEPQARLAKEREIALEARRALCGDAATIASPPAQPTEREEGEKPPKERVIAGTKADPAVVIHTEET